MEVPSGRALSAESKSQDRAQGIVQAGDYFILKSMEIGSSFRSTMPKCFTADPNYPILSRQRSRYAHYYFYIRDPVLGPIAESKILRLSPRASKVIGLG
jgi:hypothetical protein